MAGEGDINETIKCALKRCIDTLVVAAGEVESCIHMDNPDWLIATDTIDECTDILRTIQERVGLVPRGAIPEGSLLAPD
jgi:hypothetical protein